MPSIADAVLDVSPDPQALARRVADWLLGLAAAKPGRFAVCLSGGSTPRLLYERLSASPYRETFPWSRTHWFWGDERFVPHADPQSNYRMVREALLARLPIAPETIHAIPTEGLAPDAAAAAYAAELRSFYGADRLDPARPLFDVNLLGLGGDGHTASLFPGMAALAEGARWAVASDRADGRIGITLTYPALASSADAAFLVAGADKRDILARVRRDATLPAARLHADGRMWLFADAAAAGGS